MNPWYLLTVPFLVSAAYLLWLVVGSWLYGGGDPR